MYIQYVQCVLPHHCAGAARDKELKALTWPQNFSGSKSDWAFMGCANPWMHSGEGFAMKGFSSPETMFVGSLCIKEHPHEGQDSRFSTTTLHCSHDQWNSLNPSVVLMFGTFYLLQSNCCSCRKFEMYNFLCSTRFSWERGARHCQSKKLHERMLHRHS